MSQPHELSFRVDEKIAENLDQFAQATERDRKYHLTRALTQYLDAEMRHLQAIAEGIADADAGNLIDLDVVIAGGGKSMLEVTLTEKIESAARISSADRYASHIPAIRE